ncbi:MAG: hypothetical protein ACXW39_11015 [Nitrospira sp.]
MRKQEALYEALSGDPPFVSDSEYALIRAQVEADPPRLIGRVSNVRPKVEEALMRALAKRPADRFATAAEFGRALGVSGLNGKAVDVVRHSLGSVVSKATHIEMAAPADSHHHPPGHVSKRPAEKGTRLVHAPEPGSVEKARSPASGPRRWSRRLPAAVLAAAIAMVAGVVVYAVLDLTRESPGVTQNPPTWEGSASQEGENRAAVRAQGEDAGIGSSGSPSVPGSHDETGATGMTSKPPIAPHPQEGVKQSSVLPSDEPQPTPENVVGRKAGEPPARNVHEPRRPHKVKKTPQPESPWIIRRE